MRLIDADELKKKLKLWAFNNVTTTSPTFDFVTEFDIDECPTVCDIDAIRREIQRLRGCSCYCSDGIIDDVENIIDKYTKGE